MSLIEEAEAVRQRIVARLRELEPLVSEYEELRRVAAQMGLEGEGGGARLPTLPATESTTAAVNSDGPPSSAGRVVLPAPIARSATPAQAGRSAPRGAAGRAAPRRRGASSNASGRAGPASGGEVRDLIQRAVEQDPGQTLSDYAQALGLPASRLYRPVRELTTAGVLVKRGRQLFSD